MRDCGAKGMPRVYMSTSESHSTFEIFIAMRGISPRRSLIEHHDSSAMAFTQLFIGGVKDCVGCFG